MADNFKLIYIILSQLEKDMDKPSVDIDAISYEILCITENRWLNIIEMLYRDGYIIGVTINREITGNKNYNCDNMAITIKGLEFLKNNSLMKKAYKTAKGITDLIP
jgi:hypothetical protein